MHKELDTDETNSSGKTPVRNGYKQTKLGWIPVEWEIIYLGELGEFSKGKGIAKKDILENDTEGYPSIRYAELYTLYDYYTHSLRTKINEESANKSNPIHTGDILFAGSGETLKDIGKSVAYLGEEKAYAGGDIIILKQNSHDSQYLGYLFNNDLVRRQLFKLGQGHSVVHIYSNGLKKVLIPLPPLPEQQKIAQILSTWDKAIALQEHLIAEKQAFKKGLMQELLTGKKRFAGFEEKWEEVRLGDQCKILMCKRIFASQTNENEEIPFYKIGTIGKIADTFISRKLFEEYKKKYNYPRKGEILITCSGTVGNCILFNGEDAYFQDSNIVWLDNRNNELDNKFLYYLTSNIDWSKLNSTTITRIYTSDLKKLKLKIPTKKEQQKIAAKLSNFDNEIENLIKYKDYLIQQKQGLMQQLLTGEKQVKS